MLFYGFLLVVGALGVSLYLWFFMQNVPGAAEERVGVLEALPPDIGTWKPDPDSPEGRRAAGEGLLREERLFFDEGRGRLLQQTRYRSLETREIVRVESDRVVKRRRVRPSH